MEEVKPIAADGGASSEDALTADGFVCQNKNHSGDAKTKKENPNDEANSNHAKEEKPTERQSNDESIGKNSNHDKRDNDKNNETNVKNSNHDKETAKPIGKNSDKAVVKISNLDKINAGEHSLDQCDSHEAIGDGQQPIGGGQQAVGDNQQAAGAGQQNAGEQLPGDYEDQPQDPGQQLPGGGDNNQPNDNGNGEEEEGEEDNNVEEEEEDGDEEEEEEDVEPQADAEGGNNENGAEGGNNQNVAEGGNNQIEGNGNNDPPVMEIDCGGAGDIGVPLHLESLHIYGPHGDGPHHIEEEEGVEEDDEDDNDFANDNDIVEQDNDGPPVVGLQQEGAQLDVVEGANDGPQVVGLQQEVAPPDVVEEADDGPQIVELQQEVAPPDEVEEADDGPQVVELQQEVAPPDEVEEAEDGPQVVELQQEVAPPDEVEEADDGPQVVELQQEVAQPDVVEEADDGPQVVELQQEVAPPDMVEEADDGPQVVELQQEVAQPDVVEGANDGPQVDEIDPALIPLNPLEEAGDGPHVHVFEEDEPPHHNAGPHVQPPLHNVGPWGDGLHANVLEPDVPPLPIILGEADNGFQIVGFQHGVAPLDVVEEADDGPQVVELQQEVAPPDEVEGAVDGPQVVELQQEVAPPDVVEEADNGPQVVELQEEVAPPDVVEGADDGPQVVELQQEVAPPDEVEGAVDGPQVVELQQEVAPPDVVEGANDGPQVDEIDPALIPLNPMEEAGDGPHVHVFEEDEPPHHNAGPHVQPPLHNVGPWGDGLHANVFVPDVPPHHNAGPGDDPQVGEGQNNEEDDNSDNDEDDDHEDDIMVDPPEPDNEGNDQPPEPDNGAGGMAGGHGGIEGGEDIVGGADMGAGGEIEGGGGMGAGNNMAGNDQNQANENEEKPLQDCQNDVDVDINAAKHLKEYVKKLDSTKVCETKMKTNENKCEMKTLEDVSLDEKHTSKSSKVEPQSLKNKADKLPSNKPLNSDIENISLDEKHTSESSKSESKVELQSLQNKVDESSSELLNSDVEDFSLNEKHTTESSNSESKVEPHSLQTEVDKLTSNESLNSDSKILDSLTVQAPHINSSDKILSVENPVLDIAIPANKEPVDCDNPAEEERFASNVEVKEKSPSSQLCVDDDSTLNSDKPSVKIELNSKNPVVFFEFPANNEPMDCDNPVEEEQSVSSVKSKDKSHSSQICVNDDSMKNSYEPTVKIELNAIDKIPENDSSIDRNKSTSEVNKTSESIQDDTNMNNSAELILKKDQNLEELAASPAEDSTVETSKQSTEDVKNDTETKQEESKVEKQYRQTDNAEKYGVEAVEAPKDTTTNSSIQDVNTALKTDNGEAEIKTEKQMADNYSEEKVGEAVEASKDCTTLSTQDDDADTVIKTDDNGEEENKAAKPDEQIDNNAEKFGEAVETSKDTTATSSIHDVNADSDLKTDDHGEEENKADKQTGNNAEAVEASKDLKTDEHGEEGSKTEKPDEQIDNDSEDKIGEKVEASKDCTTLSTQDDADTASKTDENGEDMRQPIVNLEKLQSPLVERTSVSLATCELCEGACPTQQCLRLRRNSGSGRVTRRGRGRPRLNAELPTENTTYTCLLCRKVMPDRQSSRKHVRTSHDIVCSTCSGVFPDCNALNEHRTKDKCGNAEQIQQCEGEGEQDAEWKLPTRRVADGAGGVCDLLGTLFASDNDDDSPSDDQDSDFTCDDHEIEEAEKEEDLDVKKNDSRRKSLRNYRTRQGKQDETLIVGKRSFRLTKNSTIHKLVAGSKNISQRNKCIGNVESTVALTKRGTPIPLRVLRKTLLENNGNLSAFGRGRNAGSSVLVTCSSSKEDENDSKDDDTISLRSGNSVSRGENSISLRSSMRISSKSNDEVDDGEDDEDDDSGLCDNLGSNSELNQSQSAGRVKCDHCGSTYSTKSNLQRHIANHCRALNGVDKDSRKKKADDLKRKKLRKYYNTDAKRSRRSYGSSSESSSSDNDMDMETQTDGGAKTQRDKGTSTTGLVYSPRLILHRIDNGKVNSIAADQKSESDEVVNISETDKSIQVGQGECNIKSAKNFRCTECRRSFYTQDDLSLHGMIHTNRTDFPCPRCNKIFPTFPNLRVHMRTHATGPPCLCDVCGKAFNTPSSLKVHMKTHDDDEKFNCSYCNRTFNFVGNLKVHERLHTGEKPYKCSLCERCFTQSTSLKLHVQSLHMQQRIPLPCDKCCRKFRSKETLERHKLCHVDYRRFKCDICDSVSFNNRAGLKHHMETKHLCTDGGAVVDSVQDHNSTSVAKLPSISVLGVKSSINSVADSGQNLSARFNPHGAGLTNQQNSNNVPSSASKSSSGPHNNQFCINGHNLSTIPIECNDYCKGTVLNQGGFNMDASRGSATSDACNNFNNSTPLKDKIEGTSSDLSSGTVGDNRNLLVNKTGFGNISPINSSITGNKNNICPPQYNVAMSSRGSMGRGRGSRGGRGRGGGASFNYQNFLPHKCGACAARFDKKVSLRRHIKESHSGPFGDVNESLMQLQNDLEDLQRIYGNKNVDNNRQGAGAGRRKSVDGRKQSTDLESGFDESGRTDTPQPDSNKPETTFTSSFNVESLLSKSPGDGDAKAGLGTSAGGESSVESKSADLDSSSNTDNFNELEGGKVDDEAAKSGKTRTKYEFGCHLCDKSFPTTMGLVRHKNFVHKVPSERCRLPMRDKPFECEYCTKRFTFETGAQKHIQRHIEKGHSKRVKKEKVIRKPSANHQNYPSTSGVSSSSYSAPPSVDSAAYAAQHQLPNVGTLPTSTRPTSLPSFKWNFNPSDPNPSLPPINHNHVYDPYHNNPNSWAAINQKPNFYKNHTYDKTLYPTSTTSHNEFGYVGNDTFSKPVGVTPSLFTHNNTNLYPGATSYSESAASKTSSSFSVPTSYNDVTSSTYAHTSQPVQSTSTYVTQEFMPKTSTDNDYTYSSAPFVGSSLLPPVTSYSGDKAEPSAAFTDNQTDSYFKQDTDYSNAPSTSYETKIAPTFEPKMTQNVGSEQQFMFNNTTDDSSYMKNVFHAAHLLEASNYEKTYYNLDSNKFKNDSAYNQPTAAAESSYSLTRLDGYATSPSPSAVKPASPYYDTPLLKPPNKDEHFNYYKSYQYPEMAPTPGQTDTNNEWPGMMYNNL